MWGDVSIPTFICILPVLIFVCHHTLMFFGQCTFNCGIGLCHSCLDIIHTFSFGRNRIMNRQNHAVAVYPSACAWQDFKRAINSDGHHCQL